MIPYRGIERRPDPAGVSVVETFHRIQNEVVLHLLGQWVSELEPVVFLRRDVSPDVLVEVGIGARGAREPQFVGVVTAREVMGEMPGTFMGKQAWPTLPRREALPGASTHGSERRLPSRHGAR